MPHDIEDGRNISTAEQNWDSGLAFGKDTNLHSLVKSLLAAADATDDELDDVYHSQHIDTAEGDDLDKFGDLVNLPRKSGESDSKYRARVKARLSIGTIGTTTDQFIEFGATVLETNAKNIQLSYPNDRVADPAQINFIADSSVYDNVDLTPQEVVSLLEDAVPAGHAVNVLERGTFLLKSDGDTDTAENGLTADNIDTGGTLTSDLA